MSNNEIKRLLELIDRSDVFLLTSHIDPDGDSIGSLLGLARWLELSGKSTIIVNQGRVPDKYLFLDPQRCILNSAPEVMPQAQVAVVLECPTLDRIGFVRSLLRPEMIVVNIDHHPDNEMFGQINIIETQASAVGEILWRIMRQADRPISAAVAEALYAAIISDTGGFRFANTTSACLRAAAELVDCGANPKAVADGIFASASLETMRLTGQLLRNLQTYEHGRICVMRLTASELRASGAKMENSEGIVDYTMKVSGVRIGVLLKEVAPGEIKVSLRAQNGIDVRRYAYLKGGGGHPTAAGFTEYGQIDEVTERIVKELREYLHD